jgi:surfactin synthase thioesterase subunit
MAHGSSASHDRWFQPAEVPPDAKFRLFLFPHAGSGASVYKDWPEVLPPDVAHQCVQLPGRQDRHAEPTFTEMVPLIEALHEALVAQLDERPFAFFGHCLGAQIAYRLAVSLSAAGDRGPVLIGASGWAPEGFLVVSREQARMPEPELLEWVRTLGSVPKDIMEDPKALAMVIPAMRADLEVVASYVDDEAVIQEPVVSYSGKHDQLMSPGAMASWSSRTPNYGGNREFDGDHFYINHNALPITTDMVRHLRREAAKVR